MADNDKSNSTLIFPRRAFVAAGLSAVLTGGVVSLGILGWLGQPRGEVFQFSRGLNFATGEEARLRGVLSKALTDDRYHLVVLGHTGDAGDADANRKLSVDRAALVASIAQDLGVPSHRMTTLGLGGAALLDRAEGESDRAFQSRLARVEVTLQLRR